MSSAARRPRAVRSPWPTGTRREHAHEHEASLSLIRNLSVRDVIPVLLLAIAVALRAATRDGVDVACLLTVAESVLDGRRLYTEVLEPSTPTSILFYLSAALMGRATGLRPEIMADLLAFVVAASSLWLTARTLIAGRLLNEAKRWQLLAAGIFIFTILPVLTFAQREHIAVMAMLPALAVLVVRANRRTPGRTLAIVAGVGVGIALSIKPHFILAVALPLIYLLVRTCSLRPLLYLENWAAVTFVLLYAAFVAAVFPSYITEALPLIRDVYVPQRLDFSRIVQRPAMQVWLFMMAGVLVIARSEVLKPHVFVPASASVGFALAFLIQGKGWPYHAYPMVALAMVALVALVLGRQWTAARRSSGFRVRARDIAAGLVLVVAALHAARAFARENDFSALAAPISRIATQPKLLAISQDPALGHPLVRRLGGKWVSHAVSQWISVGVRIRERTENLDDPTRAQLRSYAGRERAMLVESIRRRRPDVILIQIAPIDWKTWALSDPDLAAALADYHRIETMQNVEIWARKNDGNR